MAERGRLVMKRIAIIAATGCASRSRSSRWMRVSPRSFYPIKVVYAAFTSTWNFMPPRLIRSWRASWTKRASE